MVDLTKEYNNKEVAIQCLAFVLKQIDDTSDWDYCPSLCKYYRYRGGRQANKTCPYEKTQRTIACAEAIVESMHSGPKRYEKILKDLAKVEGCY